MFIRPYRGCPQEKCNTPGMQRFADFNARVVQLANQLAVCNRRCNGVESSCSERPPRGLVLELEHRDAAGEGSIVVGQNPGIADDWEVDIYRERGVGYEQQMHAWNRGVRDVSYFRRPRELLDLLGLRGPVLWTDVAKCEGKNPPLETLMICAQRHLVHELRAAPEHWPVIALGRRAFDALGYMAGNRAVLGLPHSSGSHAARMFSAVVQELRGNAVTLTEARQLVRTPGSRKWLGATTRSHVPD